jgi:hypothetical protein
MWKETNMRILSMAASRCGAVASDRAETSSGGNDEIPIAGELGRGVDHQLRKHAILGLLGAARPRIRGRRGLRFNLHCRGCRGRAAVAVASVWQRRGRSSRLQQGSKGGGGTRRNSARQGRGRSSRRHRGEGGGDLFCV